MPTFARRDPRTKEELLDRMLSFDFDGDIRHLGSEPATIVRTARNRIMLKFPSSDREFEFVVRIPRGPVDTRPKKKAPVSRPRAVTPAPVDGQPAPEPRTRPTRRRQPSPALVAV